MSTARRLGVLTAAAALLLAGCGGGDTAATTEDGLVQVRVGTIPTVDAAPLYLAQEQGIFAEHGLEVEIHVADGGAAVIPAVISGEDQFGYSNVISSLLAADGGLPVTLVQDCCAAAATPDADTSRVLALPDGPIRSAADLAGANIAVNTLQNIGEVTIKMALQNEGIDISGITFTQLAFSDMNDALERGDVDAIWQVAPNVQTALDRGFVPLLSPFVQAEPEGVLGHYLTSQSYAASDPEVVQDFVDAMAEANAYATDHLDEARATIVANLQFDQTVVEASSFPLYPSEVTQEEVEVFSDKAIEYGIIPDQPDWDTYLWQPQP